MTAEEIQKSQWEFIIKHIAMYYGQLPTESDIEFLSKKCMETYTLMINH